MPLRHIMPTIEAALATLQANLPAAVTAYNAEPAHAGNPLDTPVVYYKGQASTLAAGGFPSVEAYIARGELTHFPMQHVAADTSDRVVVIVTDEQGSGEVTALYEKIVGLGEAAMQVLVAQDAFGSQVEVESVAYEYAIAEPPDPSDPLSREVQGYRTSAVLEFRLAGVVAFG